MKSSPCVCLSGAVCYAKQHKKTRSPSSPCHCYGLGHHFDTTCTANQHRTGSKCLCVLRILMALQGVSNLPTCNSKWHDSIYLLDGKIIIDVQTGRSGDLTIAVDVYSIVDRCTVKGTKCICPFIGIKNLWNVLECPECGKNAFSSKSVTFGFAPSVDCVCGQGFYEIPVNKYVLC